MKTITVRPLLIDCDKPVTLGSIMECIKLSPCHIVGFDNEIGEITLNVNPFISTNEFWKHKELILISLNDDIKKGDEYYSKIHNKIFISNKNQHHENEFKVIARQSEIFNKDVKWMTPSRKATGYITQFIHEYNTNSVKDIEIEMEKDMVLHQLAKLEMNANYGIIPIIKTKEQLKKLYNIGNTYKPKLTNGFITIVDKFNNDESKKEHVPIPMIYSESEVKELCQLAMEYGQDKREHPDLYPIFGNIDDWFNNNKKKI